MEKLLEINIHLTGFTQVKGKNETVNFINFDGYCSSDFFEGKVIEGGVDTQKYVEGKEGSLSARYILDGKDGKGLPSKLFIENNGTVFADGRIETVPHIVSDNEELEAIFSGNLFGKVLTVDCPEHDKVLIEIYKV